MLTPTDTHLLAGILTKMSTPENVEIILGEMVYDEASERRRDIDITVKYKNDEGEEISFIGLHVKDHSRPLGSPEIEQLCLHLKDSPSINRGGIISASGYSKPGIKKAEYHGVDLYELKDWDISSSQLAHVRFPKDFKFEERRPKIYDTPKLTFNLSRDLLPDEEKEFSFSSRVYREDGEDITNLSSLTDLANNLINQTMNSERVKVMLDENDKTHFDIDIPIVLSDSIAVMINEKLIKVTGANIKMKVGIEISSSEVHFKILTKLGDLSYDSGTAIFESKSGLLLGLSTSNFDKSLKLLTVPIADRLRNKIHELRIK